VTGAGGGASLGKGAVIAVVSAAGLLLAGLLVAPMMLFASSGLSFESGNACSAASGQGTQPVASTGAKNSIPANYLTLFKSTGARYGVPWVILAGIAKVESDDGRSSLPGVHSGSNAFGAAGPMQIGIGGASGNTWGGTAIHPASEKVSGVATDGNGDGIASVYDPADAIAGAANAIFFNHGQCCCAGSRLLVEREIFDEVVAGVAEHAKKIKLGPGLATDTQMGPLVSEEQLLRVINYLHQGKKDGACFVAGGGRAAGGAGTLLRSRWRCPGARMRRSWLSPRPRPAPTSPSSPGREPCRGARWPSWSASSDSWQGRSVTQRPSDWCWESNARPARDCR